MLSPKMMSLFSCNLLVVFCSLLPSSSRHSGLFSLCVPRREEGKRRGRLVCISLFTQHFLQQQPLEKMAKKEIPIQRAELSIVVIFSRVFAELCSQLSLLSSIPRLRLFDVATTPNTHMRNEWLQHFTQCKY
ncbi:hypothetical protein ACQKWADRAFT_73475 [Trichoderma austrokoningii]